MFFLSQLTQRIRNSIKQQIKAAVREVLEAELTNVHAQMQRRALEETADFVLQTGAIQRFHFDKRELLLHAVSKARSAGDGLFVEFGVFRAESLNAMARKFPDLTFHGFDSFEGLRESFHLNEPGVFKLSEVPEVEQNVTLYKGFFDATLPEFLETHTARFALAHIDCDLYSSTKDIFTLAGPRFQPGTVLLFDDYYNYPGWKDGEHKAFTEFLKASGLTYDVIGGTAYAETYFKSGCHQFCVQLRDES